MSGKLVKKSGCPSVYPTFTSSVHGFKTDDPTGPNEPLVEIAFALLLFGPLVAVVAFIAMTFRFPSGTDFKTKLFWAEFLFYFLA